MTSTIIKIVICSSLMILTGWAFAQSENTTIRLINKSTMPLKVRYQVIESNGASPQKAQESESIPAGQSMLISVQPSQGVRILEMNDVPIPAYPKAQQACRKMLSSSPSSNVIQLTLEDKAMSCLSS